MKPVPTLIKLVSFVNKIVLLVNHRQPVTFVELLCISAVAFSGQVHRKVLYASDCGHLAFDELVFLHLKLFFAQNVLFLPLLLDIIHPFGENKSFVPVGIQLICQTFLLGPFF